MASKTNPGSASAQRARRTVAWHTLAAAARNGEPVVLPVANDPEHVDQLHDMQGDLLAAPGTTPTTRVAARASTQHDANAAQTSETKLALRTRILTHLRNVWPEGLTREQIAHALGLRNSNPVNGRVNEMLKETKPPIYIDGTRKPNGARNGSGIVYAYQPNGQRAKGGAK